MTTIDNAIDTRDNAIGTRKKTIRLDVHPHLTSAVQDLLVLMNEDFVVVHGQSKHTKQREVQMIETPHLSTYVENNYTGEVSVYQYKIDEQTVVHSPYRA